MVVAGDFITRFEDFLRKKRRRFAMICESWD